jgi:hypothetical protein
MNHVSVEALSGVFLGLTAVMAALVLWALSRYLEGRARTISMCAFVGWLVYVGVLGYLGIVGSVRPPGPPFVVAPTILFMALYLTRNPGVREFAKRVPTALLIGAEFFRVVVELVLHGLYKNTLVPKMLTYEGANFDIIVGLSAPVVACLFWAKKISGKIVRIWCFLGIFILANIVIRAFLTFPGPFNVLRTEVPNTGIGVFPFTFLPGFLAPLALYLHVLTLRGLGQKK